ncbi:nyd-sp28 protein [Holotrichia oblita]|uniref:Nyd-sp28 protein n=1 Tax=Holotrichia oblita TaxID=644536 RepID=A0ACB9ST85_HOLOL|nr:nyd-sp28 protein [Holotrichia oblita]
MPPKHRLSAEEKKALKAQKKAERKARAEEKKLQLKYDYLHRELKYGELTIQRHEKNWKKMLLDIAIPEMRKELEYAWHNFERVVDAKDFHISLLMDEIRDSEEQYMMNIRSHCENVDSLIKLFKEQHDELKVDNDIAVQNLQADNEGEVAKIMSVHKDTEDFLNMMLYGLEMTLKEQEQFIRCEYCSRIDEELGKNAEILQKMRFIIHKDFAKLWNTVQEFLDDYFRKVCERKKQYEFLNNQDEQVNALLRSQLEKIRQMNSSIKRLKQRYIILQSTQGQKVCDLLMERQFFADSFWALKTQLEDEINTDNKNLTLMTVETNESIKYLNELLKKGEEILTLASLCRKYETLEEKVLPFPLLGKASYKTPLEVDIDFFDDIADLKLFWKRIGRSDAIRYSMYEEKEFLIAENDKLRKMIHEYCQCLNCAAFPVPQTRRKSIGINRIDGNQEMKKYAMAEETTLKSSKSSKQNLNA